MSKAFSPEQVALARRVEDHFFKSWPAMGDMDLDGWRVRIAGGYTRRANSVTPVEPGSMSVHSKVMWAERFYGERGLQTVFRITNHYADQSLDEFLQGRGYLIESPTDILKMDLPREIPPSDILIDDSATDVWIDGRLALDPTVHPHLEAMTFIHRHAPSPRAFARIEIGGRVIAIGRAVVAGPLSALDAIRTDNGHLRRGHARSVMNALLSWSRGQGAEVAWLQVVHDNESAQNLYRSAGFQSIGGYHYRVKPTPRF
jgi:GNAT superfamily N-acetyltransferase